ncbi:hypothetical protein GOP47_0017613 [Adiantum capillus-veneris]|uniref:C2 NT-type domain-containing protein n=1 Tax=Adiantum capillus-veneris TaxID=13818 RepID=A0A9D4UFS4_ADICA|nr:hypothetical protein GOP47_0017613 [Adiantum capillus-veneris]
MVVKMMKWRPWPSVTSKKFQVYLTVQALEGLSPPSSAQDENVEGLMVDVKWKGPKSSIFPRRSLKRLRTTEKQVTGDGIVCWEEKSDFECDFMQMKNNSTFQPWDVHFVVLKASHQGAKTKLSVVGAAVMDIANFIGASKHMERTTRINVTGAESEAFLVIAVSFLEIWPPASEAGEMASSRASLPCIYSSFSDPEQLVDGASDRAPKSAKRPAESKVSQELYVLDSCKLSSRSETSSHDTAVLFDSDSLEEYENGELDAVDDSSFRKSFSYGTLAGANLVHEGALPSFREAEKGVDCLSSIHSRVVADASPSLYDESALLDVGQAVVQQKKIGLSWKKRRLFFGSPRAKGEPLLNKAYGDDGGDDIDHDRRQSCSSPIEQVPVLGWKDEVLPLPDFSGGLDFGDEMFSVGSWEIKDFVSRDGHMKLSANIFFASIDQRNERAAGESACTALVAVIADWLQRNPNRTPIKAEFDSLIREGSAEWRRLCDNEAYQSRFPDGHFDLDTVLEAKVRPLRVSPERSFVGFFQPEGVADMCNFLEGAMLFDNIWDAIIEETKSIKANGSSELAVYIVSWNDHFFILKVDADAFYIIDTLGERLYEGCDQAYIIRFDKEAKLCHVPVEQIEGEEKAKGYECPVTELESLETTSPEASVLQKQQNTPEVMGEEGCVKSVTASGSNEPVYEGKEACKCFLKEFFAAVPLRELQVDLKKGLLGTLPLHQRLQIEFHFMSLDA